MAILQFTQRRLHSTQELTAQFRALLSNQAGFRVSRGRRVVLVDDAALEEAEPPLPLQQTVVIQAGVVYGAAGIGQGLPFVVKRFPALQESAKGLLQDVVNHVGLGDDVSGNGAQRSLIVLPDPFQQQRKFRRNEPEKRFSQ